MPRDTRASSDCGAGQPAPQSHAPAGRSGGHRTLTAVAAFQLRLLGIGLLALSLLFGIAPFAQPGARAGAPRVAIIVGPVGSLTASYRADGERAAAEARRYTDDVVTVYSPNATWAAAKAAMTGASIVVYLGHGNGWPSRYSRTLNPRTQNGLGLNPLAGVDNVAHQYFGEAALARSVKLAPDAVVVLSHLCYASGNSEPGQPEGSLAVAKQRVDNFAAGFLAAGASAVIADGYMGPAYYVRSILAGKGTLERIWRKAPNFHAHVIAFPSVRTPGLTALMDPIYRQSGFYRSLVGHAKLRAEEVARGAARRPAAASVPGQAAPPGGWQIVQPPEPSAAPDAFALGARPGTPTLVGMPLPASTVKLQLPVKVPVGVRLSAAYQLGTRWIPLDVAGAAADRPLDTDPSQGGDASQGAATITAPDASPAAGADTGIAVGSSLVAQESAASLVEVVPATVADGRVSGSVTLPAASGRYRLEVTLHDADGVALPYAVQVSIPRVVAHVGGPGAAWLDAPPTLSVVAGTLTSVQVVATNGEATPWGSCSRGPRDPGPERAGCPVRLMGRWVALDGPGTAEPMTRKLSVPAAAAQTTWLSGPAPTGPGAYLLVLSLERTMGAGQVDVLGRPTTVKVLVAAARLVPPAGDVAAPQPTPGGTSAPLLPDARRHPRLRCSRRPAASRLRSRRRSTRIRRCRRRAAGARFRPTRTRRLGPPRSTHLPSRRSTAAEDRRPPRRRPATAPSMASLGSSAQGRWRAPDRTGDRRGDPQAGVAPASRNAAMLAHGTSGSSMS